MFTLIFYFITAKNSISTVVIPGFFTEAACIYAGGQQEVILRNDFNKQSSFSCVKMQ